MDISEIQVNFDLEESEMRIFSEDETLVSIGSGSLMSNCSPRILPGHKFNKSLVNISSDIKSFDAIENDLVVKRGETFITEQA